MNATLAISTQIRDYETTLWHHRMARSFDRWPAVRQLGRLRFCLLLLGMVCQMATVWITWPLWQTRTSIPHLPAVDLPQVSFGWMMMVSVGLVVFRPSWGIIAHWIVLVGASTLDQFRLQPQFFSIAILMTACVWEWGRIVARWHLASMWLWAGLHKLLSADWFGHASYWLVERLDAESWYLTFAVAVALSEFGLGMLACFRPKWAAVACVPIHLGIVVFLLMIDWNPSVIPWNLSMAATGCWVMWHTKDWRPTHLWEVAVCIAWLVTPIGFFTGWVDHGFAAVLYSDSLPRGLITTKNGVHAIQGWGDLVVPFPNERRTLRIYFQQYAESGDKLHISDPRRMLNDQFFVLDRSRQAQPIDVDTFFSAQQSIPGQQGDFSPTVAGVGLDERRAVFALGKAGVRMLRAAPDQPIYAVAFTPENYDPDLLAQLQGLPNLTQIQLSDTSVQNSDLRYLLKLRLLIGIGLDRTNITDEGLRQLRELPLLQYIECEETKITERGLAFVLKMPDQPQK